MNKLLSHFYLIEKNNKIYIITQQKWVDMSSDERMKYIFIGHPSKLTDLLIYKIYK